MLVLAFIVSATTFTADAQFRFGPKVGLTVNDMHFNKSVLDSDNQTGWTAGVMGEFTIPVIGISADLSAMYVRRNAKFLAEQEISKDNRSYIELPLNFRYNSPVAKISTMPTATARLTGLLTSASVCVS